MPSRFFKNFIFTFHKKRYIILVMIYEGDIKMQVFDIHTHIFPDAIAEKAVINLSHYYNVKMDSVGTYDSFKHSMQEAEIIKKCLVFSTATTAHQVESVNNFISGIINENIYGFGSMHPDYDEIENEIDRLMSLGLRGIKIHSDFQGFNVDCKAACRIYEYAQERGVPILFHAGDENVDSSSPKRFRHIKDMFPGLIMILAHLGGYSAWDESEKYLVGQDVYFDTSSTLWKIDKEQAIRIIRNHGADRCFFGTDFPMHNPKTCIEEFMNLGLSEEENHKILWQNAIDFFERK